MIRSSRKKGERGKLSRTAGRLSKVHKNNPSHKRGKQDTEQLVGLSGEAQTKMDWRKVFFLEVEECLVATNDHSIHFLKKGSHGQVLGVLIDAKSCDAVGCAQSDRDKEVWQYWLRA